MKFGGGEATGWIRAWRMLDVLPMLGDQGWAQCCELFPKLWDELGPYELLNRCFGRRI